MVLTRLGERELGVFLPVANGGWIISTASPPLDALWANNLKAAVIADEIGLDFVMSMAKWRGFGGETDHWGSSLESVVMMGAIAQATQRVKVWATIHPLLQNPAVTAKMITTLDHISGGRAGLNIVAGAYRGEFDQMGAWDDDLDHDARYALTEEWTDLIKRLWAEPRVTSDGRFFHLKDCVSEPKPVSRPRPDLICAGMSERGFQFSVREADACFIGGRTQAERRDSSVRAKAVAETLGKTIKTYAMCTIVQADTDGAAETLAKRYDEAADIGAVMGMMESWGMAGGPDLRAGAMATGAFMTQTAIGSAATCAEQVEGFLGDCELDGLMLIFPDYEQGLTAFGAEVMPLLAGGRS